MRIGNRATFIENINEQAIIKQVNDIKFFYVFQEVNNLIREIKNLVQHVSDICRTNDIQSTFNDIVERLQQKVHRFHYFVDLYFILEDINLIIWNENFPKRYVYGIHEKIQNLHNIEDTIIQKFVIHSSNGPSKTLKSLREKVCLCESDESCAICLKKYEEKEILTVLNCNHSFDKECIKMWLKNHNTCPICREIVNN